MNCNACTLQVAEMTGRKGRVVQTEDGNVIYESRSEHDVPLEILNIKGELLYISYNILTLFWLEYW